MKRENVHGFVPGVDGSYREVAGFKGLQGCAYCYTCSG